QEETLQRRQITLTPDHPDTVLSMNNLARAYLMAGKPEQVESLLRPYLALHNKKPPDDWQFFESYSLLGAGLLDRKSYADAEPPLIKGYEEMKARESQIPVPKRKRLSQAGRRIVALYEAWGKPDRAEHWRRRLGEDPAVPDLPHDPFAP